uniref:Uncharacterized protein n=1 Tax=Kalanchoe fedtschenkoi TaxID=63787 RepID=A0A7N0RJT6_KALFE
MCFHTSCTMRHWSFPQIQPLLLLLLLFIFPGCFEASNSVEQPQSSVPTNGPPSATMIPAELETLFRIMEAISSDHTWRVTYPNPCHPGSTWPGVECKQGSDGHSHVTRLEFGTRPNPTCKPTARFPSQIFQFPFLESVFFISCFTRTRTSISILGVLCPSSLQQLSLRSNPTLTGSIPLQISSFKSLQVLTLSQNRLTGSIPVAILNLISLVHLDLSYNLLEGTIPYQIGNLRNLVVLDLAYNSFTGLIPSTVGQLGLLQKLDLSSNALHGTIPTTIQNLGSLVFLALSDNKLRGNFPQGLDRLQNLQFFLMDDNPLFIPLPYLFGRLVKLQELSLANCGFSGTIPLSFSHLSNLTTLYLQKNMLTGGIPASFANLSHLYHLNLSRNMLAGVVPSDASFLSRLGKNLDLSGNPGLCLSPAKQSDVTFGINVCGHNGTIPNVKPLKSEAASKLPTPSMLALSFFGLVVQIQLLLSKLV